MENIVIAVRFRKTGKLEYFDPYKYTFKINDKTDFILLGCK